MLVLYLVVSGTNLDDLLRALSVDTSSDTFDQIGINQLLIKEDAENPLLDSQHIIK
jgi:hypothetical protein